MKDSISQKPQPTRILILNSFAVNNGDAALVLALYNMLKSKGYSVTIATYYYNFLKSKYPELPFIRELGDFYFLRKLPFLRTAFMRLNFFFNKKYRNHDIFISSPGGYINSYYSIRTSLLPLVLAKKIKRKTAIYSQSIGPLTEEDTALFRHYSKYIDLILARDEFSMDYLRGLKPFCEFIQTKDAAFLLPPKPVHNLSGRTKVAVSVREWSHDNRKMDSYKQLMIALCLLLLKKNYSIEFLSTCQGVPNYKNDAAVALDIMRDLLHTHPQFEPFIAVDTAYYKIDELMPYIHNNFGLTIGTRLHMCIISMLQGVPAFNISYEIKGYECYKYMGMEEYSADFNEQPDIATKKLELFLQHLESISTTMSNRLKEIHAESLASSELFVSKLIG